MNVVLKAENVGKKFSRTLKQMMFYGARDMFSVAAGVLPQTDVLRDGEFWAVKDVSFELKRGECLGIIGSNGSGKTTLLRMLNGIFMPDAGRIEVNGKVGGLIHVGAGFHPMLTGRENIYVNGAILGMTKAEIDRKFDAIVAFADIGDFLDSPVRFYSSGMYVRLGFAVAVHSDPDILLIDEVLSVGDSGFQMKCLALMNDLIFKRGCAVVFVSHNRYTVEDLCKTALYLDHGQVKCHGTVRDAFGQYLDQLPAPSLFSEKGKYGEGEGIVRCEFVDRQGREITSVPSGEFLKLRLHYHLAAPVIRPAFGITFNYADPRYALSASTEYLFNLHSGYAGLDIPALEGCGVVEVEVPQFIIPVGKYRVCTYLFVENALNLVQKNENAASFEVCWREGSVRRSLMDLPADWKYG